MRRGRGLNKGKRLSEETKSKMSKAKRGKMPKNIKQIQGWNKGIYTSSTEVKCNYCGKIKRVRNSKFKIQKHFFCNLVCMKKYRVGENHPMFRKKYSKETLTKISNRSKRMWRDKTFRKKRSLKLVSKRPFSEAEIINSWKDGLNLKEIMAKYNYQSRLIIKRILLSNGIKEEDIQNRFKNNLSKLRRENWNNLQYIEQHQGKNHLNWKGGNSIKPYTEDFNQEFKITIRSRDNQICMMCGIHREKLSRALDVHHINYDKTLSIPQNCVSLCSKCHRATSLKNREYWTNFFQSLLTKEYGYQYSDNKIVLEVQNDGI